MIMYFTLPFLILLYYVCCFPTPFFFASFYVCSSPSPPPLTIRLIDFDFRAKKMISRSVFFSAPNALHVQCRRAVVASCLHRDTGERPSSRSTQAARTTTTSSRWLWRSTAQRGSRGRHPQAPTAFGSRGVVGANLQAPSPSPH
jgi:hypothetical protein